MIPPEHKQAHEVQLTGWGESMKSGPWVKFRVDQEAYERFKQYNEEGKNQQRFHLVAVPIDDNEEPKPAPEAAKRKKPFHELSRPQQAGILCDDPAFQDWIMGTYKHYAVEEDVAPLEFTARMVRIACNVTSRTQLNEGIAACRWDDLVARYREETQMAERR